MWSVVVIWKTSGMHELGSLKAFKKPLRTIVLFNTEKLPLLFIAIKTDSGLLFYSYRIIAQYSQHALRCVQYLYNIYTIHYLMIPKSDIYSNSSFI